MSFVPPHLRSLVVEQDYGQYDEQDQAVWRFVVMQTHARLLGSAHPAYAAGFAAAGISVDRIAHIARVSERLADVGWSAVCVDGFIPPRAFQAFQAASVLPIAADIRTSAHLTYTPAPDIIHEAAGHAPFLANPGYARFLRRIGEVGRRAFCRPFDRELYQAIHTLSEVKEDPASTPEHVARAEQAFERLSKHAPPASEAAQVARLYWWTVEYGLVGTLARPQLYGAGLLSSIGEGHFCLRPELPKLPLSAACVEVDYDVTREQPQLFVAQDFEQLDDVLESVAGTLAQRNGGLPGLEAALAAQELGTLTLDSELQLVGQVREIHAGARALLVQLSAPCRLLEAGRVVDELPGDEPAWLWLEPGALLTEAAGRVTLRAADGSTISGTVVSRVERAGRLLALRLQGAELRAPDGRTTRHPGPIVLVASSAVTAVEAGAPDGLELPTAPSGLRVPKPRTRDAAQRELVALYERVSSAFRSLGGAELERACAQVVTRLAAAFPDEWLLRFNLLESLVKAGEASALQAELEAELERLELRFGGREPIATGLAYVRALAGRTPSSPGGDARPSA